MEYAYIILKRDIKSLLLPSGERTLKSRLASIAGIIGYTALAVSVGYGAYWLFGYIRTALAPVPQLAAAIELNILHAVSLFMLIIVFMTGIQTTYKVIYESDDIGFLMAQPVPVQAIFLSKFASSYVTLAAIALVFGIPVWLGYALAIKAGVGLYVLAILGLSLVLLVAHSLVTFLLLLAMRHLPGRKMKQLFIASSAVLGVLIVLVSQLASSQLARVEDPTEILEAMGKGQLERTWYLPSTWMVNAVLGLSPEYGLDPLPYGVALVGAALGFSSLAVGASGRWFLAGWSGRTEETGAGRKKKNGEAGSSSFASSRAPAGTYWTVLRKDLKLLFRDPLVWYNLVIGAITIGFFIFNQKTQASMRGPGSIMDQTMMSSLVTFISVLMGAVAGAQTGGISLSREGSSFWLLGGNPVSAGGLFAAKYTYALMPPAVLFGLSLAATSALGLLPGPLYMPILLGLSMVVAVASAQILLDVYFPDFSMKVEFGSSQKGKGSGKLLTTMLGSMAMLFALFFILILPTTNLPRRMFPTAGVEQVAAVTQALVICLGALMGVSAVVLGSRRMKRILTDM